MRLMGLLFQQFYHYADISRLVKLYVSHTQLHLKARSKTVIVSVSACKLKALANSRGSYPLAEMETSNNTLDQVHSIFVR